MEKKINIINFFTHQWSFALEGLIAGLGEVIYFF